MAEEYRCRFGQCAKIRDHYSGVKNQAIASVWAGKRACKMGFRETYWKNITKKFRRNVGYPIQLIRKKTLRFGIVRPNLKAKAGS